MASAACKTLRPNFPSLLSLHLILGRRKHDHVHLSSQGRSTSAPWLLRAGLLDCLSRLHKWPHGLGKKQEWLTQATQAVRDIMAQHVRDARNQGITPEERVRRALSFPG